VSPDHSIILGQGKVSIAPMKRFLSHLGYPTLILLSLVLGLSPFVPEPHLVEKLRMLREGTLTRPLDIFDLFFHLAPAILLMFKLFLERPWRRGR
jgi:hypothetical protein